MKTDAARWVAPIRRLIATGHPSHLQHAIKECDDPKLRQVLTLLADGCWEEAATSCLPVVQRYDSAGREAESAAVFLVLMDKTLGYLPECDPDVIAGSTMGIERSRQVGFFECEARYLKTLGICALLADDHSKAESLLLDALAGFELAAEDTPEVYDIEWANALVNLAAAQRERSKYDLAERNLRKAISLTAPRAGTNDAAKASLSAAVFHLATAMEDQGEWDAAVDQYARAIYLMNSLLAENPQFETFLARTLNNLGNLYFNLGTYDNAVETLGGAVGRFRHVISSGLADEREGLASALNNISNAYQELRLFPDAQRVLEEALEIQRSLSPGSPVHRKSLAMTLTNVAGLQFEREDWDEAKQSLEEALGILRGTGSSTSSSREQAELLSGVLNSLGMVYWRLGDFKKATSALDEVVQLRRGLNGPNAQRDLSEALQNRATILRDLGQLQAAVAELVEARDVVLRLSAEAGERALAQFVSVQSNLVVFYEDLGQVDAALRAARETVQRLESAEVRADTLWLLKGKANSAYGRIILQSVMDQENEDVLRGFAALRSPMVRLSRKSRNAEPQDIASELRHLSDRVGRRTRIICAQAVGDRSSVMAIIGADGTESTESVDEFHAAASKLFRQMTSVFRSPDNNSSAERDEEIRKSAEDAWRALPGNVRLALSPDSGGEVLISGDSGWSQFPWEGLRFRDGAQDWLGLQRSLPRIYGLSGDSLSRLGGRALPGRSGAAAAIIAPWDVGTDATRYLPHARDEAVSVARRLSEAGFDLVPGGRALIGADAHAAAVKEVLAHDYALLHFAGHGDVVRNQEVLEVPSNQDRRDRRYIGRGEIVGSRSTRGPHSVGTNGGALVVLNACFIGQTHSFGGRREDLVGAFLAHGSEAVIASPVPVFDDVGRLLGDSLYDAAIPDRELGKRVVKARQLIESATRGTDSWPGWAFASFHGNPFACFDWLGS